MKARPILFNTDMVQAILAGRKTQTRRELNPQPELVTDSHDAGFRKYWTYKGTDVTGKKSDFIESCPFGQPGDLLYVRETFRLYDSSMECACYDPCTCSRHHGKPMYFADGFSAKDELKWKPSIHMPREFSRLTLEITDVRVERLQEISEEDAKAEGIKACEQQLDPDNNCYSATELFSMLWVSLYGHDNYAANPWVWKVSFSPIFKNVDEVIRERI